MQRVADSLSSYKIGTLERLRDRFEYKDPMGKDQVGGLVGFNNIVLLSGFKFTNDGLNTRTPWARTRWGGWWGLDGWGVPQGLTTFFYSCQG
jgi:hypothetical protein